MKQLGILGGAFNPVHIAHLRLALECAEQLGLDKVLLLPAHIPAHKDVSSLLPYSLRVDMLLSATFGLNCLEVSTLEAELPDPSYTWNSLISLNKLYPDDFLLFILGVEDFASLDTWHRGLELPGQMDFVIVDRTGAGLDIFAKSIKNFWPEAVLSDDLRRAYMPDGRKCSFFSMPPLNISSSIIRKKWLKGQDIRFLVPDNIIPLLEKNSDLVKKSWSIADD